MSRGRAGLLLSAGVLALTPAAASADCPEPGSTWPTSSPGAQGLDDPTIKRVLHAYQDRRSYAVRIYRNGCLVARDTNAGSERSRYETWEITSSVLALAAGRAMQLGVLSPDDLVGALVPEADAAHGAVAIRDLLAQASGLAPEPDDVYLRDRLRSALATPLAAAPGVRAGDAPVARALLAEVVARAAGTDVEAFVAGTLFAPLGITTWRWSRDEAGRPTSTFGLQLSPDDLARLAELVRRGGVWRGQRLLDDGFVTSLLAPGALDSCLAWMTWVNAEPGCRGSGDRLLPGLPADLWEWRGRADQRVTVLPALGLLVVRLGMTASDQRDPHDGLTWERGILQQLLNAVRDTRPQTTPGADAIPPPTGGAYIDDARSRLAPVPAIPPAGPLRARAPRVAVVRALAGRARVLAVRATCPQNASRPCAGTASLDGAHARTRRWAAPPGGTVTIRLRLLERLRAPRPVTVRVVAADAAGGVPVAVSFLARP